MTAHRAFETKTEGIWEMNNYGEAVEVWTFAYDYDLSYDLEWFRRTEAIGMIEKAKGAWQLQRGGRQLAAVIGQ